MTYGGHDRIPVPEPVFAQNALLIFRFHDLLHLDALHLAVLGNQILSLDDIALFKLRLKPLVDLVFCLRGLHHVQPVPAGTLGILRGDDLDPVAVVDHIVDGNQLPVHSGSDHLVAHRAVYAVCKVNGIGTSAQRLHIAARRKTVHRI